MKATRASGWPGNGGFENSGEKIKDSAPFVQMGTAFTCYVPAMSTTGG